MCSQGHVQSRSCAVKVMCSQSHFCRQFTFNRCCSVYLTNTFDIFNSNKCHRSQTCKILTLTGVYYSPKNSISVYSFFSRHECNKTEKAAKMRISFIGLCRLLAVLGLLLLPFNKFVCHFFGRYVFLLIVRNTFETVFKTLRFSSILSDKLCLQ